MVGKETSANLDVAMEPPVGHRLGSRRLHWKVVGRLSLHAGQRPCGTAQQRTDQTCPNQPDSPFHCATLTPNRTFTLRFFSIQTGAPLTFAARRPPDCCCRGLPCDNSGTAAPS